MTAWIAQHLLRRRCSCARVAGLLDTRHAVDLAKRMPPESSPHLAMQLDPRRARDILFALPPALIGKVAAELDRRDEHIAMGRFVGPHDRRRAARVLRVIDGPSLLRISYFVEVKDQLDHVVGAARRRARARARSASATERRPVAAGARPARRASRPSAPARSPTSPPSRTTTCSTGMVATAQRDGLWDVVLPVTRDT